MKLILPRPIYCVILTAIISIFLIAKLNLDEPNFWFDESGQFWNSYGVLKDAPPFSPPGGLRQIWQDNINGNLDPPLFTFLLRAWMTFSTEPFYLRTLPFLFFILNILILYLIGKSLRLEPLLSLAICLFPLTVNHLIDWSIVLRAYSLWTLSFLILMWFSIKLSQQINIQKTSKLLFFFSGVIFSFCLLTRYSIFIAIISLLISLLFCGVKNIFLQRKKQFCFFVLGILPGLFVFSVSFFGHVRSMKQNIIPHYTFQFHISRLGLQKMILLLFENIGNIFFIIPLIFLTFFFLVRKNLPNSPLKKSLNFLFYFTIIHHGIYLLLSFLRLHPWAIGERFCLDLIYLSFVNLFCILSLLNFYFPQNLKRSSTFLTSLVLLFVILKASTYRFHPYSESYELIVTHFKKYPGKTLYVDWTIATEVRFLFEHGKLKQSLLSKNYPKLIKYLNYTNQDDLELNYFSSSQNAEESDFLISTYGWPVLKKYLSNNFIFNFWGPRGHTFLVNGIYQQKK